MVFSYSKTELSKASIAHVVLALEDVALRKSSSAPEARHCVAGLESLQRPRGLLMEAVASQVQS